MSTVGAHTHVVVIFGGESAEHDVSCVTAAHVIRALDPEKYRVTTIGIDRSGKWLTAIDAMRALERGPSFVPERLAAEGEPTSITPIVEAASAHPATVMFPLLHGPLGEDGTIQGVFELANVPYVGTGVLGSAVAMDKTIAKQLLAANDIPQPKFISLREDQISTSSLHGAIDELGLPLFVKPANMGSSVGISKVKSAGELEHAIRVALTYDEWVVLEEAVKGREIEVAVLGNRAVRCSVPGEIVPSREFYDYEDKYVGDGAQLIVPAKLDDEEVAAVQRLATVVFHTLHADGMARVDFFYEQDGRGFLCNEINTIPGFTPISMYPKLWQATGLSYAGLLDELIALALERHGRKRRNTAR